MAEITLVEKGIATESKPEHKVQIYQQVYHGVAIKIVELDHEDSSQAGIKYKMPPNWREQLTEQIYSTSGPIAPEYCMPDLEKGLFNELGTGETARLASVSLGITPFFGHISKFAGAQGRVLLATDIANTNWYFLFARASGFQVDFEMTARESAPNIAEALGLKKYGYEYGEITPGEYQLHTSNDARHLVTARGLMQVALSTNDKQILSIWSPKHAERIYDYIIRQIEYEIKSQTNVTKPVAFKDVSPKEECGKMAIYGRPPFQRTVREYVPILPSIAYEIDLMLNDSEQKIDLDQVSVKIETYLESEPKNNREKEIYGRIKRVQNRIHELKEKGVIKKEDCKELADTIKTDRFGWRLKRKSYIY